MGRPRQPRRLQRRPFGGAVRRGALLRPRPLHGRGVRARVPARTGHPAAGLPGHPDGRWTYCGPPGGGGCDAGGCADGRLRVGKADDAFALTVYRGRLYWVSNHRRGVFVYEGGERWSCVGPDLRILSLAIYHGNLYALINGGPVYRYEGGSSGRSAAARPDRPRPTPRSPARDASTSAPGPRARCTATRAVRPGPRSSGSATSGRSWPWPSTTARSTSARCRWPTCGGWMPSDSVPGHAGLRARALAARVGDGRLPGPALRGDTAVGARVRDGSRDRGDVGPRVPPGWRHVAAVRDGGPCDSTWTACRWPRCGAFRAARTT